MESSLDGAETDIDSDASDYDAEENMNHLGGNMLREICEMNVTNNNSRDDATPPERYGNISEDSDPEMNVPLATFVKCKRTSII
ncbi:unnamed protein product [Phaedon cochleariae]|uniref:Uncharacterized protein n=1 Tax=Phaedon cochleariae TaxID=80249 RepID=A0A9N9SQI9_PHACE|nr:unnamed protein product [Phaedon cochleariae]